MPIVVENVVLVKKWLKGGGVSSVVKVLLLYICSVSITLDATHLKKASMVG